MSVVFYRIDDRLVHGQIMTAWAKVLDIDRIIDKELTVRRINVTANHILHESLRLEKNAPEQMDLFTDYEALARAEKAQEKERSVQEAVILLKRRFGKNIILKGMNFEEGATAIERNMQIGGHKA